MATFKIKCEKNKAQTVVTIRQKDSVDISGEAAFTVNVYTDDLIVADNTYGLTAGQLNDLLTDGVVNVGASDLLLTDDDFYTLELVSENFTSNKAGVGITLEATGKVYNKQGLVDVYSPQYRVDNALNSAHMMLQEMNSIESQDYSLQKRIDFTTRLARIQQILNY